MAQHCGGNSNSSLLRLILCFMYICHFLFFPLEFCRQSMSSGSKVSLTSEKAWTASSLCYSNIWPYDFFHLFRFRSLEDVCGAVQPWFTPLPFNLRNIQFAFLDLAQRRSHSATAQWSPKSAEIFNVAQLYWDPNTFLLTCQINLWKHAGEKAWENPILF